MSALGSLLKLTSLPQKLMLGGGAVLFAGALVFNIAQLVENRHLSKQNTSLEARINDPATGYVVKLAQARTNSATCTAAITRQNDSIKRQSTKDAAATAAVQRRYDAEHKLRVRAENSAAAFLAREPKGDTATERMLDVDAQILGDLK